MAADFYARRPTMPVSCARREAFNEGAGMASKFGARTLREVLAGRLESGRFLDDFLGDFRAPLV